MDEKGRLYCPVASAVYSKYMWLVILDVRYCHGCLHATVVNYPLLLYVGGKVVLFERERVPKMGYRQMFSNGRESTMATVFRFLHRAISRPEPTLSSS
jgi:hypothetical protein